MSRGILGVHGAVAFKLRQAMRTNVGGSKARLIVCRASGYQAVSVGHFSQTKFLHFSPDYLGEVKMAATVPNAGKHEQKRLDECQFKVRVDKAE